MKVTPQLWIKGFADQINEIRHVLNWMLIIHELPGGASESEPAAISTAITITIIIKTTLTITSTISTRRQRYMGDSLWDSLWDTLWDSLWDSLWDLSVTWLA